MESFPLQAALDSNKKPDSFEKTNFFSNFNAVFEELEAEKWVNKMEESSCPSFNQFF